MKLRIQGNSLRLRLTQSEVEAFRENGRVEEHIRFRPGEYMVYALEASDIVGHLAARYEEGRVTLLAPSAQGATWADTDQVGMEGEQRIEGDEVLTILVEKDFKCMHGPASRQEEDAFPNPLQPLQPQMDAD